MSTQTPPDPDTITHWLNSAGVEHYLCDQCHGLHLPSLQDIEGVLEGRLFQEEWGLLISVEFPIRPTGLLPLVADMANLNADFATLKLFVDVIDDAVPQLVASTNVLTDAGLSQAQFELFVGAAQEAIADLAGELKRMDFLLPAVDEAAPPSDRVH